MASNLEAMSVCKRYGATQALNDINIEVVAGEFLTLLGPSGSGKTTFLMAVAGFVDLDSGTLKLNGADITNVPAESRGFGMVFQGYALFPHLSVAENISFPLQIRKCGAIERNRRVNDILDMVGLSSHRNKRPQQLSGGQQQRVALARALVYSPSLLLLDEPFSALDKNLRVQMHAEIRRIHREIGTTFIFVSHDQAEALALSDRIAIFDQGCLQQIGQPQDLYERPANRFCAQFLGQLNVFPLEGHTHGSDQITGRFEDCRISAPCDLHSMPSQPCVGVRPEYMTLSKTPLPNQNSVPVLIDGFSYQGASTKLTLKSRSGFRFEHDVSSGIAPPASSDEGLWLTWPIEKGLVV
jgi:putative spermidine/putrescine transport system ATP-binding protein